MYMNDGNILLSAHREENIDSEKNFLSLFTAMLNLPVPQAEYINEVLKPSETQEEIRAR